MEISTIEKLTPRLVGIEACGTSHHRARELMKLGHARDLGTGLVAVEEALHDALRDIPAKRAAASRRAANASGIGSQGAKLASPRS